MDFFLFGLTWSGPFFFERYLLLFCYVTWHLLLHLNWWMLLPIYCVNEPKKEKKDSAWILVTNWPDSCTHACLSVLSSGYLWISFFWFWFFHFSIWLLFKPGPHFFIGGRDAESSSLRDDGFYSGFFSRWLWLRIIN